MKELSASGSPLPMLAVRAFHLAPNFVAALDKNKVAHPATRISESFWSVAEQLHEMLIALDFDGLDGQAEARRKRNILGSTELLMHRCAALNDYLGVLMRTLLPSVPERKMGADANAAKRRLDAHINRLYKIPINFIKHEGFGLSWIEMSFKDLVTHGYMVTGPIGDGVQGSVKFLRPGRDDPEGYSFALTLREVLPAMYQMCAIAEEVLADAGILPTAMIPLSAAYDASDARGILLVEMLELLNRLPLRGFPDEHRVRVPIFSLQGGSVTARTAPLRKLPGTFKIQSELRSVRKGGTYKLPYWKSAEPGP
ncbi:MULTISPECIES: hypothetical protein [Xanthomonas]|uniref:hypothetical protein n=1 Tax=Xanthomonas TaxID=338 RepID=UPI001ADA460F|nr:MULTISPECIES: hypothetical protein [unclassified Xanthomonas]MBO9873530.1 hypothetical protein [Xanthomonas sp. D-93]WNH45312.1 hypothetical protein PG878_02225 [Xanthomonas sp. A6251]